MISAIIFLPMYSQEYSLKIIIVLVLVKNLLHQLNNVFHYVNMLLLIVNKVEYLLTYVGIHFVLLPHI